MSGKRKLQTILEDGARRLVKGTIEQQWTHKGLYHSTAVVQVVIKDHMAMISHLHYNVSSHFHTQEE